MPKLLDQTRDLIRTRHYSRRTEESYVYWIRKYIFFHNKRHSAQMGADEVSRFLTQSKRASLVTEFSNALWVDDRDYFLIIPREQVDVVELSPQLLPSLCRAESIVFIHYNLPVYPSAPGHLPKMSL